MWTLCLCLWMLIKNSTAWRCYLSIYLSVLVPLILCSGQDCWNLSTSVFFLIYLSEIGLCNTSWDEMKRETTYLLKCPDSTLCLCPLLHFYYLKWIKSSCWFSYFWCRSLILLKDMSMAFVLSHVFLLNIYMYSLSL